MITGGIGAGKSVVSRVLRCNGFNVYDCDSEAKHLMIKDPTVKKELCLGLGECIYSEDGSLNKKVLAEMIFNDEKKRGFVNSIVHEAVRKDIKVKRGKESLFFIESAIPVTGGLVEMCDSIWMVITSEKQRIERVGKRDKLSEEEIKKRVEVQEVEMEALKEFKPISIENYGNNPLLGWILKKIDKLQNIETYTLLC